MKMFRREALLQMLGAPILVLVAYGLDAWRLSDAVLRPRELLRPTAVSVVGSVLPQVILCAVAFLLGWYLLVRNRPSVRVSLFYCAMGGYLLSYMPVLLMSASGGMIRKFGEVLYYPCLRLLPLLSLQHMLQISFAFVLVLGLFGMGRCFTQTSAAMSLPRVIGSERRRDW